MHPVRSHQATRGHQGAGQDARHRHEDAFVVRDQLFRSAVAADADGRRAPAREGVSGRRATPRVRLRRQRRPVPRAVPGHRMRRDVHALRRGSRGSRPAKFRRRHLPPNR